MFPSHFRHLRLVVLAAIVLAFSSQVLLAQSDVRKMRVQTKQRDTLQTKPKHIKTQQTKTKPTNIRQIKTQQTKPKQIKTQEGKVTKLKIGVKPTSFNGHCPATFDFHCTITVNHSPATVEYEWVRSDGVKGPKARVEIRHGSVTVSDRWQLGEGKQHLREWEKVHIISPKDMNSPAAVVNVNCR